MQFFKGLFIVLSILKFSFSLCKKNNLVYVNQSVLAYNLSGIIVNIFHLIYYFKYLNIFRIKTLVFNELNNILICYILHNIKELNEFKLKIYQKFVKVQKILMSTLIK